MYFAKHETFHIRDGWVTKGLRTLQQDPRIFFDPEAPERLGMGKNMVRSLRFWMQATGLTEEVRKGVLTIQKSTLLGQLIHDNDPYLEHEASLWLIHYNLVCSRDLATAWYYFFNHFVSNNFSREDFVERLSQWIIPQLENGRKIAKSSLKKDFATLVKTYLPDKRGDISPEDSMECPLTNLGLMSSSSGLNEDDKRVTVYRYEPGTVENIHPLIFLYVILQWQNNHRPGARQVNLTAVLREPMNAGRTFNIGLTDFEQLLMHLNDNYDWRITLTRTAGLDQLTLPDVAANTVLCELFQNIGLLNEELGICWQRAIG